MADSPDNEIQVMVHAEEEYGQGDIAMGDDASVYDEPRENPDMTPPYRPNYPRPRPDNKPSHKLYVKPEPFDGSNDWEEYFSHFTNCAELGHWTDHEKVLGLSANLRGPARVFYMSLSPVERKDYHSLVYKLSQRFGSVRQQNKWLSKFETRKRQQGESIAALGDDLRQMAQKAYRKLGPLAQEALALNQLYKSISLDMKSKCIDKECETVAAAVDIIERHEAIYEINDKKRPIVVRQMTADDYNYNFQDSKDNYATVHAVNSKSPPVQGGIKNQTITNDNLLKQLVERIANLESSINKVQNGNPYAQSYSQRNGQRNMGTKTCYQCNSTDHFIRNCPQRNNGRTTHQGGYNSGVQQQRPVAARGDNFSANNQGNRGPSA